MGSNLTSCCKTGSNSAISIFKSQESKTIEIVIQPPSSIDTANIELGSKKGKLSLKSFDILRMLGRGAFARVFLVRIKGGHKLYALKLISKKTIRNQYALDSVLKEREILLKANHPFVVKLRYSFQDACHFCYIMDYMKGGPISKYIESDGKNGFSEDIVRYYASQVLLALEHLHDKLNCVYRDLKPDNILLDEHGNIKLADFGISQRKLNSW